MKDVQDHFEVVEKNSGVGVDLTGDFPVEHFVSIYKCRHCDHKTMIPGRMFNFEIPMMAHLMVCRAFWQWVHYEA